MFSESERNGVYRAIHTRRDVRSRFRKDPIDEELFWKLLAAAHAAPSVGLMQPWRFVRVQSADLRERLARAAQAERLRTADALGDRRDEFLRLKVEGILDCAEVLVVALADDRERHVFGRRTLPEMDVASVGCAIENLWLACRAEEIGLGWVSLFDPARVAELLKMPQGSKPLGILCLGYVEAFDPAPALQLEGWAEPAPVSDLVFEDQWGRSAK